MSTSRPIAALEHRIGYRFSDSSLLQRALTHRSWAHDQVPPGEDYERLEFLGDAVLGFVVAQALFDDQSATEGRLTRARAELVCKEALAARARALGLGEWLRLGKGEENSGGREKDSILADALEALIGAVYRDGGIDEATRLIQSTLREGLERRDEDGSIVAPVDSRSRLQEHLQQLGQLATYRVVGSEGAAHDPVWIVELVVDGEVMAVGRASTKQQAAAKAATEVMESMLGEASEPQAASLSQAEAP